MKRFLLSFSFLAALSLSAQTEKGASPITSHQSPATGTTRAVVVGISDYQHPGIPDLKYAHRDAEEFAAWLSLPGGGSTPKENIKLLLNEQATSAQVAIALTWLLEVSKPGDRAIFFFSGHADVESKVFNQLGFLLTWDTPAQVYMAASFSLLYLQSIVSTLSQNNVKTLIVTDACRSGNLAGSAVKGSQATNANLAVQFANEIKILSCQPTEYSIEGERWGGGRGVFSYYLMDGLYGFADKNADAQVNLLEIGRYLEDEVPAQAAPQPQTPMIVGPRMELLASVDLAAFERLKKNGTALALGTNGEAGGAGNLSKLPPHLQEQVAFFQKNLKSGSLEKMDSAYQALLKQPQLAAFGDQFRREFAAALQDEVQQALNALLESDPYEANKFFYHPENYSRYPEYLQRSIELLGEDNYQIPLLKAKKNYFVAFNLVRNYADFKYTPAVRDSIYDIARALLFQAVAWEPTASYLYFQLGFLYSHRTPSYLDSVTYFCQKAIELSPTWLLPYIQIADEYLYNLKDNENGELWMLEARKVKPKSYVVLERLNWLYQMLDRLPEATRLAEEMLSLRPDLFNSYGNLAGIHFLTKNYGEAEKWYRKALEVDNSPSSWVHQYLAYLCFATRRPAQGKEIFDRLMADERTPFWAKARYLGWQGRGLINFTSDYKKAEEYLRQGISLDHNEVQIAEFKVWIAKSKILRSQWTEAKILLEEVFAYDSTPASCFSLAYTLMGEIELHSGNRQAAEAYFLKGARHTTGIYGFDLYCREEAMYRLGAFLLGEGNLANAEDWFRHCVDYAHGNGYFGWYGFALLETKRGNDEAALENLSKALDRWLPVAEQIVSEPLFTQLRKSVKFKELLRKHFPEVKLD